MANNVVSIVDQGGKQFVTPRALRVTQGGKVIFRRVDLEGTIRLLFPDPDLFGCDAAELGPNDNSKPLPVQNAPYGVYPFAVYSEAINGFVRATPDPVIIVDE